MPSVPRLENNIQERGAPVGQVQENYGVDSFGGGQAAKGVYDEASSIFDKYKKDADQAAVLEADKKLTDLETKLLHDPNGGALNKRGKDTFGLPDTINEEYKKEVEKVTAGLNGTVQKQAFAKMAQDRGLSINRTIDRHVSAEISAYDDQQSEAYVAGERDAALLNYRDKGRAEESIQRQELAIRTYGSRHGMSEEAINQKLAETKSGTYTSIIQLHVDKKQDGEAQAYYDSVKDKLTGKDNAHLEKILEVSNTLGYAQRFADDIEKKGMTAEQARKEVMNIQDPKKREAARDHVNQMFSDKHKAEEVDYQTKSSQAMKYVQQGKDIPPSLVPQLKPSDQAHLATHLKNVREGNLVATDIKTYADLNYMAANPATRDEFMRLPISSDPKYLNTLDAGAREYFIKKQADLVSGKGQKELDGLFTNQQLLTNTLDSLKIKHSDPKAAQLKFKADEEYQDFIETNGRKPTNAEMKNMVNDLTAEVVTSKGFLWDSTSRRFELSYEDQQKSLGVKKIDDVPDDRRKEIESALKMNNKTYNSNDIVMLYNKHLSRKSNK